MIFSFSKKSICSVTQYLHPATVNPGDTSKAKYACASGGRKHGSSERIRFALEPP